MMLFSSALNIIYIKHVAMGMKQNGEYDFKKIHLENHEFDLEKC